MDSSDPFIARRATGRRETPGMLNTAVLRGLPGRFQRRALRSSLLDRLLRRLAIAEDARGQALIWRMTSHDARAAEASVSAPGHFLSHSTTLLTNVLLDAAPVVPATTASAVHSSASLLRGGLLVTVPNGAAEPGVSETMQFVSRRTQSERALADFVRPSSRVPGRHDETSAVEIKGERIDDFSANEVLSTARVTRAVAVPAISPRSTAVFARESESIVLRRRAMTSDEPSLEPTVASQTHARPTSPTPVDRGSPDGVGVVLASNRRPPVVQEASRGAFETGFTTADRARQVLSALTSTTESVPDGRAQNALVLHKPPSFTPTTRVAHGAEEAFPRAPSDSRSIRTSTGAAVQRDRNEEAAIRGNHVDLLMERLVSDLELEARRRGHFRWR
jgi:hypothetical protein